MKSLGIELSNDDKRLPYLYWTPKPHKSPVKHSFIAGSSKCTAKQLYSLLTKILKVIKIGKYCNVKTSHTGINNMWILKNSTDLLSYLAYLWIHKATSIQTFDFSTLYISITHDLLKSSMNNIINNAFKQKNGATQYTHIKVSRNESYFTNDPLTLFDMGFFGTVSYGGGGMRAPILTFLLLLQWSWHLAQVSTLLFSAQW